jgi:hypothetical protein
MQAFVDKKSNNSSDCSLFIGQTKLAASIVPMVLASVLLTLQEYPSRH